MEHLKSSPRHQEHEPQLNHDRTDRTALGRDHGISRATAYHYIDEVIDVLAGQTPDLHQAALQRTTAGPGRIGDIVKAALVLTPFEHDYLE
ncbi:hypothetical protein ACFYY8_26965 [Streptosporangium sp. NPDC001559]|uniref:hypothetical protein n=1 Tax=Streptosporangium sp. NPDC001559 TaxID=3366187 RepID=UPI0036E120E3